MAANQIAGDGLSANLAGMSKNQLYDIMSQMKTLIEQNQQQARQILIQNPGLTKALFQAQIMLGMVQPPQEVPNIQPAASQHSQQTAEPVKQLNAQATPLLPVQIGLQDQTSASQPPDPVRKLQQNQPVMPIQSSSLNPPIIHSQSLPSHPLQQPAQQPRVHHRAQSMSISLPQSSQIHNMPPLSHHPVSQPPSVPQLPIAPASAQLQQPLQASGISHMPLQPPLPPQPRPPSMPSLPHQIPSQVGHNAAFPQSGPPQLHHSQSMFHSGMKPPTGLGHSFPQGPPPLPSQPPSQSMYQPGGSHLGTEFSQVGGPLQVDRGSAWMPGLQDNATGVQLPGPPPYTPGQMGQSAPSPHPPTMLTPEMEKALLQQVMSLTPEQINMLPLEQRNQVLQLQQMLRQ